MAFKISKWKSEIRIGLNSAHLRRDNLLDSPCFIYFLWLSPGSMSRFDDDGTQHRYKRDTSACVRVKELTGRSSTRRRHTGKRERTFTPVSCLCLVRLCLCASSGWYKGRVAWINKISVYVIYFRFQWVHQCECERILITTFDIKRETFLSLGYDNHVCVYGKGVNKGCFVYTRQVKGCARRFNYTKEMIMALANVFFCLCFFGWWVRKGHIDFLKFFSYSFRPCGRTKRKSDSRKKWINVTTENNYYVIRDCWDSVLTTFSFIARTSFARTRFAGNVPQTIKYL